MAQRQIVADAGQRQRGVRWRYRQGERLAGGDGVVAIADKLRRQDMGSHGEVGLGKDRRAGIVRDGERGDDGGAIEDADAREVRCERDDRSVDGRCQDGGEIEPVAVGNSTGDLGREERACQSDGGILRDDRKRLGGGNLSWVISTILVVACLDLVRVATDEETEGVIAGVDSGGIDLFAVDEGGGTARHGCDDGGTVKEIDGTGLIDVIIRRIHGCGQRDRGTALDRGGGYGRESEVGNGDDDGVAGTSIVAVTRVGGGDGVAGSDGRWSVGVGSSAVVLVDGNGGDGGSGGGIEEGDCAGRFEWRIGCCCGNDDVEDE